MTVNQPVPEQPEKKPRLEDGADGMDIDPEEAEGCSPTKTKRRRFSNKDHVHGLMRRYYEHIFPHEAMYQWLVYGHGGKHIQVDETFFQRREFCFTLDGDIFVRYQSFKDGAEMRSAILRKCPAKIDIGPVYTVDPARRHAYAAGSGQGRGFHPVERELVFDIDLTDYDDVRNCGKGGHICCRCWPLMAVAIQVLDAGLRQDFGFQNILWVFSGRRGVHCWVCDARARRLTDEQRSGIASFFGIYKGREKDAVKLATSNYQHPAVARAHKLLLDAWTNTVLTEQRILDTPCTASEVLKMVPDEAIVNHLKAAWQLPAAVKAEPGVKCEPGAQCEAGPEKGGGEEQEEEEEEQAPSTSLDRWNELAALVEKKGKKNPRLRRCLADIVFAFCYPRLDIEVSRKMNHLLKAPFCIHPKTGKLCAPIDPASAWQFNPEDVPTAAEMLNEFLFDSSPDEPMARRSHAMDDAVNTFKATFLDRLQDDVQQQLKERTRAQVQAKTLAW